MDKRLEELLKNKESLETRYNTILEEVREFKDNTELRENIEEFEKRSEELSNEVNDIKKELKLNNSELKVLQNLTIDFSEEEVRNTTPIIEESNGESEQEERDFKGLVTKKVKESEESMVDYEKRANELLADIGKLVEVREDGSLVNTDNNKVVTVDKLSMNVIKGNTEYINKESLDILDKVNTLYIDGTAYEYDLIQSDSVAGFTQELEKFKQLEINSVKHVINSASLTGYFDYTYTAVLNTRDIGRILYNSVQEKIYERLEQAIVYGDDSNRFYGILQDKSATEGSSYNLFFDENSEKIVEEINENTLDELYFDYLELTEKKGLVKPTVILSTEVLKEFSLLRNTLGQKVYEVDLARKTINGLPFVEVNNKTTEDNTKFSLAMGDMKDYNLAIFGGLNMSTKVNDNRYEIVTVAGHIKVGGAPKYKNAFLRVELKKEKK